MAKKIIKVASFSTPGKFYEVDLENKTCTCPAYKKRGMICKHLQKALGIYQGKTVTSVSLLKSALQKAVRRNKVEKAVRCAKSLIEVDEYQFLRRLPIIILEDGILHPEYDKVISLLKRVSKKAERLKGNEKRLLINVVAQIAKCEYVDDWMDTGYAAANQKREMELRMWVKENYNKIFKLPEKERELLMGIKYRSLIGGMAGDIEMLNHYFNLWAKRFVTGEWDVERIKKYFPEINLNYSEVKMAEREDILLEAVDFHCSPLLNILMKKDWVVNLIKENYPNLSVEEALKGIIWKLRSGVTVKKHLKSGEVKNWYGKPGFFKNDNKELDEKIFQRIKEEIDGISRWYLTKV